MPMPIWNPNSSHKTQNIIIFFIDNYMAHTCPECGIPWILARLWRTTWTVVRRWRCRARLGGAYPVPRRKPRRNKRSRSDCTGPGLHNTRAHGRPTLIKDADRCNKYNNNNVTLYVIIYYVYIVISSNVI